MTSALDLDRVTLSARIERWPLREPFRIARGARTEAVVVVVEARSSPHLGRGEAVPYARYGETPESVLAALAGARPSELDRLAGAARAALEAALLDLETQVTGVPVHERLDLRPPAPFAIATTLSIDTPDSMARRATEVPGALLKLKLAGDGLDVARLRAVADARPDARLWLDANEGLDERGYQGLVEALEALPVVLLEQPLPEGRDAALARSVRPRRAVSICADESAHDAASFAALVDRYDAVNVKLQKAGGLVPALRAIERARALNLDVVLGCMVSTSLAIAPAALLAPLVDFVDLDGALFLAKDRDGGGRFERGLFVPPTLWGTPR